jgi:hypothetical protein
LTEINERKPVPCPVIATIEVEVIEPRWQINYVLGVLLGDADVVQDVSTRIHNCWVQQVSVRSGAGGVMSITAGTN